MDWRLISAVTLASASFSMVAFGAYTLRAADAVPPPAGHVAPLVAPPALVPIDASDAGTVKPERGVSFVPVAPGGAVAAAPMENPAPFTAQVAALEGASPVLVADVPVLQDKVARPSWRHRHPFTWKDATWKVSHHVRFCTVMQPCGPDRKQQVAVRHTEEPHSAPKIALMLGVGF
jgi:hypothetical protein